MVRLSLASLAPFRTLKEKVMLKLTMVLSGIAVHSRVSKKRGRHAKETGMPRFA
jgi:hypothetical protein